MSLIYADPTERLQENRPAIILEINTKPRALANAIMLCDIRSAMLDDSSKGFLPILSDNFPRYGDEKN